MERWRTIQEQIRTQMILVEWSLDMLASGEATEDYAKVARARLEVAIGLAKAQQNSKALAKSVGR